MRQYSRYSKLFNLHLFFFFAVHICFMKLMSHLILKIYLKGNRQNSTKFIAFLVFISKMRNKRARGGRV